MTRVIVAEGCREVDSPLTGRRYYARGYEQGGSFDMHPADARMAVAMGGAVASLAGAARRSTGFRCGRCGFGPYTRRCGRCGNEECEREMTSYAVAYTTGGAEPEKNGDGGEFTPEHAVPIIDGVAVPDPAPAGEAAPPRACTETTKAGEPCKGTPGDDGLCAAHKPRGDDGAGTAAAPVDADPPAQEDGQGQEAGGEEEIAAEDVPGHPEPPDEAAARP